MIEITYKESNIGIYVSDDTPLKEIDIIIDILKNLRLNLDIKTAVEEAEQK